MVNRESVTVRAYTFSFFFWSYFIDITNQYPRMIVYHQFDLLDKWTNHFAILSGITWIHFYEMYMQ